EANGWPTAVMGTLDGGLTTPDAPSVQRSLASYRDAGRLAVAMEVSSHALIQRRVDAIRFAVAVFTNLSQDHLDYHRTMDAYFSAKRRLFEPGRTRAAVVNADDDWGRRLLDVLASSSIPTHAFSDHDAAAVKGDRRGTTIRWRD